MRSSRQMVRCLSVGAFLFAWCCAGAQAESRANQAKSAVPDYDVATVKVNDTGSSSSHLDISDDILRATNVQLLSLLQIAFDIPRDQIAGMPHWAQVDRYDLAAKVVDIDPEKIHSLSDDQQRIMLQHLLESRFRLRAHVEARKLSVLKLTLTKDGIKFAAWQKSSDNQEHSEGSMHVRNDELTATGVSMDRLAHFLSSQTHRPVVDDTGLKGTYNFHLKWQKEEEGQSSGLHDQALPTIYAALPEQLGLKLESGKGPVNVLVVDHIEPPTEN